MKPLGIRILVYERKGYYWILSTAYNIDSSSNSIPEIIISKLLKFSDSIYFNTLYRSLIFLIKYILFVYLRIPSFSSNYLS